MQSVWHKLTFKLPTIILLLTLVPLLALGYFSSKTARTELEATQVRASDRTAKQFAHYIEVNLVLLKDYLVDSAKNLGISSLDPFEQEWILSALISQRPQIIAISLLDPTGREQIKISQNQVFLPSDLQDRSKDPVFQSWQTESWHIGPVTQNKNGGHTFELSFPLIDPASGNLSSILIAQVDPTKLLSHAAHFKIGDKGQVYVVDNDGAIMAHKNNSLIFSKTRLNLQNIPEGFQGALSRKPFVNLEGVEVFAQRYPVDGTNWQIIAERPVAEVEAPAREIQDSMLWLLGFVTMFVAIANIFIIRQLTRPLQAVEKGAKRISEGDFGSIIQVSGKDEIAKVSSAFNLMQEKLRVTAEQDAETNWLKTGLSEFEEAIRGEKDLTELGQKALAKIGDYLNIPVGALYVRLSQTNNYLFAAGLAFKPDEEGNTVISSGEGILGRSLHEARIIELDNLPDHHLPIASALGESKPNSIMAIPLRYNEITVGGLELGALDRFDESQRALLESLSTPLAAALSSMLAKQQLDDALIESQQLNQTLQAQQEELRVANEELEQQTQLLRSSEEELRNQQDELQATNEELEEKSLSLEEQQNRLTEKNRELMNIQQQLEQQAQDLSIANKYKSEFLANMSHELRTPLNSMLILSQDLAGNRNKNLAADQVESAEIIHQSGKDLLNLINEILDLAKIEAGKTELKNIDVNLVQLTDRLYKNFNPLAADQALEFSIDLDPELPTEIETDPQRLEQILRNLISNAIKFTEKGSVKVTLAPNLHQDHYLDIAVSDTGIGIAKEQQQKVFNAFEQLDGSISRKFGGTGLGLSISKELSTLLGGTLAVKSVAGNGSTFTLTLPYTPSPGITDFPEAALVVEEPPQPSPPPQAKAPSIPDNRDELSGEERVILIIEDDLVFARHLAERCTQRHFKFIHAGDAETGLTLLHEYQPDAIILDIKLPGMQGMELLDLIKKDPDIRHIPVHMMSVNENTGEALEHGAVGYLQKPVNDKTINKALEKIEKMLTGGIRQLLVVEDDPKQQKSIGKLIGNGDVKTQFASTGEQALQVLDKQEIDCIVLDLNLPDMTGFELLKTLAAHEEASGQSVPPTIIYTGQELSREEVEKLHQYTESIIIKGVQSPERLLDEVSLFLHRVVKNLPDHKQRMIAALYDPEVQFKDKKILLADDDMRNVFALTKVLENLGAKVYKAADGKMALERLAAEPDIQLVLMDIMMPVMDGYEAIRQIRNQNQYKELPIIALTAKAMPSDREDCIAAGANDYMAKPIEIDRLLSLLRVWLSGSQRKV